MSDLFNELVLGDYDLTEDVTPVPASKALDYPDVAVHDDRTGALTLPGNSPNTPEEAIAIAKRWSQERIYFGEGHCLAVVHQYYGVPSGVPTAADSYFMSKDKHHVANGSLVPRGVPVYWTGGGRGAGHIAISVGGGLCLSTDWASIGRIDYAHIDEITSRWALTFQGYTQEVNGVLVWRPPLPIGTVHLHNLKPGQRNQDVLKLKRRMHNKGYTGFMVTSSKYGRGIQRAYARYQTRLGFSGSDANGVPGAESLRKLGFAVLP